MPASEHLSRRSRGLSETEAALIAFFVRLAQAFSLPKSLGEIFGLVFCSPEPVSFDEVVTRLGLSKGSASQGLRLLQKMNAVRTVYVARDRRTFYEPELSMKRIVSGFLSQTVIPHLRNGTDEIEKIFHRLDGSNDPEEKILKERLEALRSWNKRANQLLPAVMKITGVEREARK